MWAAQSRVSRLAARRFLMATDSCGDTVEAVQPRPRRTPGAQPAREGSPKIRLVTVFGDLLDQPEADALVNPWNRNFVPPYLLLRQGCPER